MIDIDGKTTPARTFKFCAVLEAGRVGIAPFLFTKTCLLAVMYHTEALETDSNSLQIKRLKKKCSISARQVYANPQSHCVGLTSVVQFK